MDRDDPVNPNNGESSDMDMASHPGLGCYQAKSGVEDASAAGRLGPFALHKLLTLSTFIQYARFPFSKDTRQPSAATSDYDIPLYIKARMI